MAAAIEQAAVLQILTYCGFTALQDRTNIADDGFESYADMLSLTEKDIGTLAKGFADRTVAQGRINFGLRRTNLLKATIHWAQDFRRISRAVTLDTATVDAAAFRIIIEEARQRAATRKHNSDESDGLSKAADPGKLKRQKEWTVWSRSLKNYLSTIQGQDGVPLSYVIRDEDAPDYTIESLPDYDFEQLCIDCAPLTGQVFKTDARKVHQLIHGFVQGETAETWIKPTRNSRNGRIDFKALEAHFGGEGNKSVRIQEAEVLRSNLTYKSERTMSFEKFLTSMQAMFTGFEDNGELLNDEQKVRLLFKKVESPGLTVVKNALKVQYDLDPNNNVTYNFIANSLSAEAAKLPDHVPNQRQASGVEAKYGTGSAPTSGVKGPDGTIFIGFYPNWAALTKADKSLVYDERQRLNGKSKQTTRRKPASVKSNKKTLANLKRDISSLKATLKKKAKTDASSDNDDDETEDPQDNAGDQFGGRKAKKKKKGSGD
jgi:hypothetical protein